MRATLSIRMHAAAAASRPLARAAPAAFVTGRLAHPPVPKTNSVRAVVARAQSSEDSSMGDLTGKIRHHLSICRDPETPPDAFHDSAVELGRLLVSGERARTQVMSPPEVLAAVATLSELRVKEAGWRVDMELQAAEQAAEKEHLAEMAKQELAKAEEQMAKMEVELGKLNKELERRGVAEDDLAFDAFTCADYVGLHAYLQYKTKGCRGGRCSSPEEQLEDWKEAEAMVAREVEEGADTAALFRRYKLLCAQLILDGDEILLKETEDAQRLRALGALLVCQWRSNSAAERAPPPAGDRPAYERVKLPEVAHGEDGSPQSYSAYMEGRGAGAGEGEGALN